MNFILTPAETIIRFESGGTFTTIRGPVGCGKSLLVRQRVLEKLAIEPFTTVVLFSDKANRNGFEARRAINAEDIGKDKIIIVDDAGDDKRPSAYILEDLAKDGRHVIVTTKYAEQNRRQTFAAFKTEDLDLLALLLNIGDGRARNLLAGVRSERNSRTSVDPFWSDAATAIQNGYAKITDYPENLRPAILANMRSNPQRNKMKI